MIHILIGTRAQLIKMIPIMHELQRCDIEYNFIFMAQHRATIYEMLDQFDLKYPDYVLGDRHDDIVNSKDMVIWSIKVLINGLINKNKIFRNDRDGVVLIHGDAPPLLLGGLIAKAQKLKVASVEAGLRSFNYFKPFPEEITRVLAAKMGLIDIFFCQSLEAVKNVEHYKGDKIYTNGNTIYDALELVAVKLKDKMVTQNKGYAVVTIHRFETISKKEKLNEVVDLVIEIAKKHKLLFILHPPTKEALQKNYLYEKLQVADNIVLLPRLSFLEFNKYLLGADFIISDGGSNQEESAYLGIPCLLFRNETERTEGIGQNVVLSKFDKKVINEFVEDYAGFRIKKEVIGDTPMQIILKKIIQYNG